MTKQERINTIAAAIEQHEELTQTVNKPMTDKSGNSHGCHYVAIIDSKKLAEALAEEGFGSLHEFKAEIINLYLKGDIAGLLTFLQEEI